jgi:hypothetical protein
MQTAVKPVRTARETIFVHLSQGDVVEIHPADSVRLSQDSVVIMKGRRS